ncbi:hypothetical protein ACFE04_004187 [Oxalis oulophora]
MIFIKVRRDIRSGHITLLMDIKALPYERACDSLLLVGSCDGSVRVWKDYRLKSKQKHVTAFSSIQGHKPGVWSLNVVVDWQQQSGYLYAFGELSSINIWDMDKEQLVHMSAPKVDNFINLLVSYLSKTVLPPSWVAFTDSERLIGEAAKNLAAVNLEKTIFDVKRFIGGK